jgi:hypothetical protein
MVATSERTLSPKEVAQQRGVSLAYVYCQLWANRIPGARKIGKTWVIPMESIQKRSTQRERRNG